ncbi:50S ribosomal protein L29 [Nesterenkonia alkaliphila]|uniref:Large ribosomal subunit protein uL29 n=1 Tax=Nesterenkonia alkaliphila TaxID=1463631 RepID=A0A7K1UJB2_9MICC|nr:50S ribosomal protein L29 [Nesterenkonia alkaliphila]MVT26559.1 50S ribosomal protein L29 [Nesterenkonia alkaliphila]
MAVGSKDLTVEKLAEFNDAELGSKLREAKEELFNLRFQSATGQLENSARLKAVKRDIARIYTVLRERELGIRESVGAAAEAEENEEESA